MEKPRPVFNAERPIEPKGLLAGLRRFFVRALMKKGRGLDVLGANGPIMEPKPSETILRESQAPVIPKPQPVAKIERPFEPEKRTDKTAIGRIKPVKKRIVVLDHLDESAFFEKMTGETPTPEDLAKLRQVSSKEKESVVDKPKKIGEILKGYPKKPEDTLDLHGKTAIEAEQEIRPFILRGKRDAKRLVRIITGKGIHSVGGQSILKGVVENKVAQLKGEGLVLEQKWERGGGALLVFLT